MERKLGTKENPRHILGLSGGKDSSALAIFLKLTNKNVFDKLEFYFTDTGCEIPETYDYIDKLSDFLSKPIKRIQATVDDNRRIGYVVHTDNTHYNAFDELLTKKTKGFLPSPNARWCTRDMKIIPMELWIGDDYCISYVGLRADEPTRVGYKTNGKITPVYPFRENNIALQDVYDLLEKTVGLPEYYKWRTRSGCYFCFYQRRVEWAIMSYLYPEWFEQSKKYETEHKDGRTFTWVKDKPLDYTRENRISIIKRYIKKQYKKATDDQKKGFVLTLDEMLEMIESEQIRDFIDTWDLKRLHDIDNKTEGCTVCAL